ncbi:MAG: GNAT family N-acetyltransferase [Clostridiales bacterium]|nr:GNAT family N-acetyltransferase [Clostridiales bacterium]
MNYENLSGCYRVRKITENDIPEVLALCKGNPTYYLHMKMEPSPENLKEAITIVPPNKTMEDKFFVGFYKEEYLVAILDLITGYPVKETAFIGWFMMKKEFQHQGLASEIVRELLKHLKETGFRYVRLGYVKGNRESESFWKRNGFLPTGEESTNDTYTAVILQKEI